MSFKCGHIYYKKLIYSLIISALIFLYIKSREADYIEQYLIVLFGGINRYENTFFLDWVILPVPFFVYIFLYGNVLRNDLKKAAVFIFIRKNEKTKWYRNKIASLLLYTVLYYSLFFIIMTLCFKLNGIRVYSIESYVYSILIIFTNCILCNFVFLAAMNVISIKVENFTLLLTFTFIAYYPVQILLTPSYYSHIPIIMFYPAMQSVLFLHKIADTPFMDSYYFQLAIDGFTPLFSLIYNLILFILVYIIGIRIVKKHDFI